MNTLVVIVNYRTAGLACECLASLQPEVGACPGASVVVADNDSGDGSGERIEAAISERGWGGWARLVRLARNGGFAYGNNRVIEGALALPDPPELIWLLNPDTVVRPGALLSLVGFMRSHPEIGIAGSRTENPDGSAQVSAFRFLTLCGEFENSINWGPVTRLLWSRRVSMEPTDRCGPVDWVSGASMMIRRSVFERIGLLDEGYFAYCEEMDFCLAASRAGIPVWHVPESRVVHLEGQSTGLTIGPVRQRRRPGYWFDSRRRYWVKNHGLVGAAMADLARISGTALFRLKLLVAGRENSMPPSYLGDLVRHSVFLKGRAS